MLNKIQKSERINKAKDLFGKNKTLVFVDFTGVSDNDLKSFRKLLREVGAKMEVIKKKLLRVAFQESGHEFNPEQFDLQAATIFSDKDISEVAGTIYRFAQGMEKEKKQFKILGAYDLTSSVFSESEAVKAIGKLPSREVLLAQLVGMLTMPIKQLVVVLDKASKK